VSEAIGDKQTARSYYATALEMYERVRRLDNVAIVHEDLADVTAGAERREHIDAAKRTWLSIDLPDQAARVERRFR
jgi:hypothetical protein